MIRAKTPTIAEIKSNVSLADARALLSIAVCETCDFFNVGKNMNDTQIALTVDLILDTFGHLRLEEIKYCFRRAMVREKVYDRIDGNTILGWLREYENERTEEAMRISDNEAFETYSPPPNAIPYAEYMCQLRQRAETDPEAAVLLESAEHAERAFAQASRDPKANEHEFKLFRLQYNMNKKNESKENKQ